MDEVTKALISINNLDSFYQSTRCLKTELSEHEANLASVMSMRSDYIISEIRFFLRHPTIIYPFLCRLNYKL